MTDDEADDLVQNIDLNDNGSIDYTEFIAGCMRSKIYLKEDNLRAAFEYFDKVKSFLNLQDKSGSITTEELKKTL